MVSMWMIVHSYSEESPVVEVPAVFGGAALFDGLVPVLTHPGWSDRHRIELFSSDTPLQADVLDASTSTDAWGQTRLTEAEVRAVEAVLVDEWQPRDCLWMHPIVSRSFRSNASTVEASCVFTGTMRLVDLAMEDRAWDAARARFTLHQPVSHLSEGAMSQREAFATKLMPTAPASMVDALKMVVTAA